MARNSKSAARKSANQYALEALREVRHMVNPQPDDAKLATGRAALHKIQAAVTMLAALEDPPPGISPHIEPELEGAMQNVASALNDLFAPLGFALLVFGQDNVGEGGTTNYVSNCVREDIVKAMAEFIARHEMEGST